MVHELGHSECPKSFVFRGSKDYQSEQIQKILGLGSSANKQGGPQASTAIGAHRFLLPVEKCELALTSLLECLQKDPWTVDGDKRHQRCTGVALNVAITLLEVIYHFNTRVHFQTRVRELCFSPGVLVRLDRVL
jgi:protein transport protein SEC23